jgi:hypothetical protein
MSIVHIRIPWAKDLERGNPIGYVVLAVTWVVFCLSRVRVQFTFPTDGCAQLK